MARVLIVDDEPDLVRLLDYNLRQAGFEVVTVTTGEKALSEARARPPDLVVLDLMLPDLPGTEVCRQLKRDPGLNRVPVLMLTAKTEELDRVVGFELGADDYVTKPFSVRELVLRVKAILRRGAEAEVPRTQLGSIRLDVDEVRCFIEGREVSLTLLEFNLLRNLMAKPGRVQSREQLLNEVWGMEADVAERTVDSHVKRLREKLGPAREMLETIRGVGYRIAELQRR